MGVSDHSASPVYLFLDESGNLDFSASGTRYFVLTCVSMTRPFQTSPPMESYKYDCLEWGLEQERFHCAEDNRHVRNRLFDIIAGNLNGLRIDGLIVDKRRTGLELRDDQRFYPHMLGYLLRYVVGQMSRQSVEDIIIVTDTIPLQRKRQAILRAIKVTLAGLLPLRPKYRVLHHDSRSHYGLQVADYCCWAIFRKYERGDIDAFRRIQAAVSSEFDLFRDADAPNC